ncbi:MAG: hypothetical protein KC656_05285, partial [Myxococcales bacterium]|nr:hypothetical protein [Myxococcales bacterium]
MLLAALSWCLAGPISIDVETLDGATLDRGTRIRLEYMLWQVSELYSHRLGIDYPRTLRLKMTLHGDPERFRKAAEAVGLQPWVGGWFRGGRDGTNEAVFRAVAEPELVRAWLHETSHFLVSYGRPAPNWLNEGLAVAIETSRAEGRDLIVSTSPRNRAVLAREGGGSVETMVLGDAPFKDLPGETVSTRYIQAWAL